MIVFVCFTFELCVIVVKQGVSRYNFCTNPVKTKLHSKLKETYSRVLLSSFSMFMVAEGIASLRMEGRLSIPSPPFPHSLLKSLIPVTICVSSRNCRSWIIYR